MRLSYTMSPLEVGILSLIILLVCLGWRYYFVSGAPCRSKQRMDGKTVLITGGNTGIGKETAIDLARRGAKVIIACRDERRASKAVIDIKSKAGSQKVLFKKVDLASLASVRTFCDSILSEEEHIDVLIANAGVMNAPYQLTEDGYEPTFAVNHLGHFLLTLLLLDRIKSTPSSRILVVSSHAHYIGFIDLENMKWMKSYRTMGSYAHSKLANVMFVRELAKRLVGTGVTAYAIHPGTINSEFFRYTFRGWAAILKICTYISVYQ